MRTSSASTALIAFLLAACTGNSPAPTSPDASLVRGSTASAHQTTRPITGNCSLTFNPPPVPPPSVHHQIDTGSCIISHLGQTAFYGEQDINFAAGTQSGWRRFTAANGDELHGIHTGTSWLIAPGQVGFRAAMTIVGGTGRFAGASGQLTLDGVATLAARSTSVTISEGTITY